MDARRAKTWRSQGLVHDSRAPKGVKLKPNLSEIAIQLRDRTVTKGFAKQALHHHRGRAFEKVLLTADIKPHGIDVNDSPTMPQRS